MLGEEPSKGRRLESIDTPTSEEALADTAEVEIPESVDWRLTNNVTPVKNEGTCSASWSFSSIASIESKFSIDLKAGKFSSIQIPKTDSNNFLTFSEQ